jgi:hypothetical protein
MWTDAAPELGKHGRTILYDRRGHFRSERLGPSTNRPCSSLPRRSVFDYTETVSRMAAAMPSARVEWVEGGHAIDPAHPVVLGFVDEVLAGQ